MSQDRDALLSERILDSMRDGVVAIDLTGRIITFNEAAGRILGKAPDDVLGQAFAEEFLLEERFDDFNELVLRAVYEHEVVHSTDIVLAAADESGEPVDLRVSSSFLTHLDPDGTTQRFGVVVVFSDTTEQRKRRKLKRLFGEYVDPRIVDEILSRGDEARSRRGDMTISFIDMRDYTGWSERLEAERLTDLLNRFLTAVTRPIGEAGGITDKFIGDAAMACWGPPFTNTDTQAADACRAALGQLAAVDALRAEVVAEGLENGERLDAVVGVATGDVLSGDIGPPESRNYTVIGNAVNLAARIQDLAKVYGVRVVVSEDTQARASDVFSFRELDRITVRGSHRPVRIFTILGPAGTVAAETLAHAQRYEALVEMMRAAEFATARDGFVALLADKPDDGPSKLMLARATAYAVTPPPAGWDGVFHNGSPLAKG
ncbi:adenylate/guanylate cyclase domain-containing protein [Acuticoccus sp. MNP-M23]|uniref:adenylate/guanylate cyclase domain-containing protein n=1 Tax=Acuticoccus sp. MNP-M23 TaxID=3072793 RepID=UPI002814A6F5|nr:adenylate/guanylate cyclase domain-containing protein [Acuticoccus sp. MNP-M23]WMS42988.1 adenylate/guanylate cyclase domain-containing protein [Acuticoccus sp. MNP-M23]